MRVVVLAVLVATLAAACGTVFSQPSFQGEGVNDVAYDGQLYISLINGTIAAYGNGTMLWRLVLDSYGTPVLLAPAPPHGLLILTDAAWLGLVSRDGRAIRWLKIEVDPNMVARGRGGLLYSNGLALVYAGATASAVRVPDLKPLGYYSLKNSFLGGSVSPRGDKILLYGFDTLCYYCIQNEDKLVLIHKPETGEQIYRDVIGQLRDAAVLWRRNWLVLAKWDAIYVYDLKALEKPAKVHTYIRPMNKWLSWGFSPSGELFHYVYADGESLNVVIVDLESGFVVSRNLPVAPGRHVLSSLDNRYGLAVVSYNTSIDAAHVLFSDLVGGMLIEAVRGLGAPKAVKIMEGRAIALFNRGVVVLPPLTPSVEERKELHLAYLRVVVVDEEGRPYQGAFVCANASCATTSTTGAATLTLREGTYILTVRHASARDFQSTIWVQGDVTKLVTLQRLYTLNVDVSSSRGALRKCSIRVYDAQGDMRGETDSCTAMFALARGVYTVEVETAQLKIRRVTAVQSDTALHFVVAENEGAAINVSVFDENGTFLPDAVISVLDPRSDTVTSTKGRLSCQLTPGRYVIQVLRPGYVNWSSTIELNGSLNLEVNLVRIRFAAQAVGGPNWVIAAAAPVVSSLATAVLAVAVYRFKLVSRLGKLIPKARLKPRMRRV